MFISFTEREWFREFNWPSSASISHTRPPSNLCRRASAGARTARLGCADKFKGAGQFHGERGSLRPCAYEVLPPAAMADGIHMQPIWHTHGFHMDAPYGIHIRLHPTPHIDTICVFYMADIWQAYGFYIARHMTHIWQTRGLHMVSAYGIHIDIHTTSYMARIW